MFALFKRHRILKLGGSAIVTTIPTSHTTVTFTLINDEITRKFWIVLGVIAAIAATIGIIFLIIKIRKWRMLTGMAKPSSQKVYNNNNSSKSKNKKPKRRKK